MALIKCPECGRDVSDRAVSCPVCGYPIASEKNKGTIRIKLGMYGGIGGTQSVTITGNGRTLWTGLSGQVAEFKIRELTNIEIKYELNPMHFGGSCKSYIDPEKGSKYAVNVRPGAFKTVLTMHSVDIIDSE